MSARSRDLISATLIAAGIPCAGEVYMSAGSTGPFESYWKDWFDGERFFTGTSADATGCLQRGYTALSSGRNDVLFVGPGTHHVTTGITWAKDQTHMVGAVGTMRRPSAIIQPHGAVSPLININTATGCVFNGLTFRNGQSTGSTACVQTFCITTGSLAITLQNSMVWGPEDDSVNDATGTYSLIYQGGGQSIFRNLLVGYGWPINGDPVAEHHPCLAFFPKSEFNDSLWENCEFHAEFKVVSQAFLVFEYSMAAGCFHTFRNCQFYNVGSSALTYGITPQLGVNEISGGQNIVYFDANCAFHGVGDVAHANNESYIKCSPAQGSTGPGAAGLALSFDAST